MEDLLDVENLTFCNSGVVIRFLKIGPDPRSASGSSLSKLSLDIFAHPTTSWTVPRIAVDAHILFLDVVAFLTPSPFILFCWSDTH